jgi:hypothetical protein
MMKILAYYLQYSPPYYTPFISPLLADEKKAQFPRHTVY